MVRPGSFSDIGRGVHNRHMFQLHFVLINMHQRGYIILYKSGLTIFSSATTFRPGHMRGVRMSQVQRSKVRLSVARNPPCTTAALQSRHLRAGPRDRGHLCFLGFSSEPIRMAILQAFKIRLQVESCQILHALPYASSGLVITCAVITHTFQKMLEGKWRF